MVKECVHTTIYCTLMNILQHPTNMKAKMEPGGGNYSRTIYVVTIGCTLHETTKPAFKIMLECIAAKLLPYHCQYLFWIQGLLTLYAPGQASYRGNCRSRLPATACDLFVVPPVGLQFYKDQKTHSPNQYGTVFCSSWARPS